MTKEKNKTELTTPSSPVYYQLSGGFSLDEKYHGKKTTEIRNELQLPSDISFCLKPMGNEPFFYVSASSSEKAIERIKEYKGQLEAKGIKVDLEKIGVK